MVLGRFERFHPRFFRAPRALQVKCHSPRIHVHEWRGGAQCIDRAARGEASRRSTLDARIGWGAPIGCYPTPVFKADSFSKFYPESTQNRTEQHEGRLAVDQHSTPGSVGVRQLDAIRPPSLRQIHFQNSIQNRPRIEPESIQNQPGGNT